jgi:hypothetical protein
MQGLIRYSGSDLDTILAGKGHSAFSITSVAGKKTDRGGITIPKEISFITDH